MTRLCAGVRESLSGNWYELPIVTCRMQSELNDTVSRTVSHFAIGRRRRVKRHWGFATRADDKFTNAMNQIHIPIGVLRGETLVIVGMPVDYQVGARGFARTVVRLESRRHL